MTSTVTSTGTSPARPAFDPELKAGLAVVGGVMPPTITPDLLGFMRQSYASRPIEQTLAGREIDQLDDVLPGLELGIERGARRAGPVSYTHLTLPTNREV